ncbi:MAG: DUF4097 family beta strand repeat protein [Anaerolineales bacterium]|nr:DUF4097 family beta strand repeat protein [Anaerolineales bacterium]
MARIEFPIDDEPEIRIDDVRGSLQVRGWNEERIRIEARNEQDLHFTNTAGRLTLRADNDCTLRVPVGSTLSVQQVGRDAYIQSIEGTVQVQQVAGSLTLRSTGEATLQAVAGSVAARAIEGDLTIRAVSGNASLRDIEGDLTIDAVDANLSLRNIQGDIRVTAGGNADLRLDAEGGDVHVQASGNLFCNLADPSDAHVRLESGAESIHIRTQDTKNFIQSPSHEFTLGDGGRDVLLQADGLIDFRSRAYKGSDMEDLDFDLDLDLDLLEANAGLAGEITEQVSAQLDAQLESVNEQLKELHERLRHTSERNAQRAQRRIEAAQRQLQSKLQSRNARAHSLQTPKQAAPVSEQERMMILQMVQDKKISVSQAEMLLNAIEGRPVSVPTPPTPLPPTPPTPSAPRTPPAPPTPPHTVADEPQGTDNA